MNIETKSQIITLTPDAAKALLAGNTANRPVRTRYVATLANAIKRGEWVLNGDAIRVSRTGKLVDGQHRCMAVVMADASIETILVTGLADDVFSTIDRGIARTTSDVLAISGESHSTNIAAVTRLLHIYRKSGDPHSGNPDFQPTTKQQTEILADEPEIRDSAKWVSGSKWCKKYIPPSAACLCHYLFNKKDKHAAESFFVGLETGAGLDVNSPVLMLRDRLTDSYSSKEKLQASYRTALIFKAFRLHRDGATVKTLRVRTEGGCPEKDIFVL